MKQYTSPADRKYGGGMGSMASATPPGQLEPAKPQTDSYDEDAKPAEADSEVFSAPLSALGGKKFNPGEEVVMKVVSVDVKNGMVELAYSNESGGEDEGGGDEAGMEHPALKNMDEAIPE